MKTSLLVLAILACACAAYARPDAEEKSVKTNKKVLVDLDELATLLRTKFTDEKYLEDTLGKPEGCGEFSNRDKADWVSKVPWEKILDAIVTIVTKVTE